jgi:hypothetical protein
MFNSTYWCIYLVPTNQSPEPCFIAGQIAVFFHSKLRRQEYSVAQSRDRIPDASVTFCGYHFKLQCPFLLRFDYKKQKKVQGMSLNMIWRRSLVFEGDRLSRGLTGKVVGHRATTNSYIAIQQYAIRSPIRRYVCPGDSSIPPPGRRR